MPTAIFNISNSTLSLAVSLVIFGLVVIWLAMVVYTFIDARRRIDDSFLVACATAGALLPFLGTAVYAILRPPELLSDAHERDVEVRAAELRVRHLIEQSCPGCGQPTEKNFMRCPSCERHLKDPCESCSRPIDPRWAICPYCEAEVPGRKRRESRSRSKSSRGSGESRGSGSSSGAKKSRAPERSDRAERSPRSAESADNGSDPAESAKPKSRSSRSAGSSSGGSSSAGSRSAGKSGPSGGASGGSSGSSGSRRSSPRDDR